ncbi:MAG: hypothetical protein FK731_02625 [Asgard group archaeon]|nr:hypothetical protein [Asgard group archaeon]
MFEFNKEKTFIGWRNQVKISSLLVLILIVVSSFHVINIQQGSSTNVITINDNKIDFLAQDVADNVINYSRIMTWGGGSINEKIDIYVEGNFAYVARQDLLIFNVTDPTSPEFLSKFECQWGSIIKVFVQDQIACLVCDSIGIVMVNASDPLNPKELGKCGFFDGSVRAFDNNKMGYILNGYISGNLVYLITDGGRDYKNEWLNTNYLYIFDIADPLYPIPVGWYSAVNFHETMTVIDSYCYFFDQENIDLLRILETTKPTKPKFIGDIPNLVKTGAEISVSNNLAIAQETTEKIAILNFTNPINPTKIGEINGTDWSKYILVDSIAYVIDTNTKLLDIYDISDPNNPILKNQTLVNGAIKAIDYQDNYLYLIGSYLQIIDVSNTSSPLLVSSILGLDGPDYAQSLDKKGSYVFVMDYKNGVKIVDYTDYFNPVVISTYFNEKMENDAYSSSINFYIAGNFMYIYYSSPLTTNYIDIVDITTPEVPILKSEMPIAVEIEEVFVKNKILYVIDAEKLSMYDVTNSTDPTYENEILIEGLSNIFVENKALYLTSPTTSFGTNITVFDVNDILNPIKIDEVILSNQVFDMQIKNDYLYVLSDEITVIDAKNASDNKIISTYVVDLEFMTENVGNLVVSDNNLCFSDGVKLVIYDLTNQTEPVKISEYFPAEYYEGYQDDVYENYPINYEITGISLESDYIVVGASSLGVYVVGVDDDSDGLATLVEINDFGTNSLLADSDSDGLSDYYEITYGLNPLNDSDLLDDNDQDGLTNQIEFINGTHPLLSDTDADGLSDSQELTLGTNPIYFDSDGEGLADGLEVNVLLSDPLIIDTDEDKIDDFTELLIGRNPTFWSNWELLFGGYLIPVYFGILGIGATVITIKIRRKKRQSSTT